MPIITSVSSELLLSFTSYLWLIKSIFAFTEMIWSIPLLWTHVLGKVENEFHTLYINISLSFSLGEIWLKNSFRHFSVKSFPSVSDHTRGFFLPYLIQIKGDLHVLNLVIWEYICCLLKPLQEDTKPHKWGTKEKALLPLRNTWRNFKDWVLMLSST